MRTLIQEFEKSGLAKNADLNNKIYADLFTQLENEQKIFLERSKSIINDKYFDKWPKDTLHWWSRLWEYPYVFYHLENAISSLNGIDIKIMDFGCGVNFFPYVVSNLGHEVFCVDNDRLCIESLIKYNSKYPKYRITPISNDGINIPIPDKTIDIAYSVSVFEHVPQLTLLIDEISRVLKDNGILIITFDISLNGNYEIIKENYNEFVKTLSTKFDLSRPYIPTHPNEILTSKNSIYPYKELKSFGKALYLIKNYLIKPFLLKKTVSLPKKLELAVEGMVLKKK